MPPLALVPLAVCFFFSGLGSLVLEVVWTRQLRLVFGSTTLAASTILVAYMLGLGLGGLAGGRVAQRIKSGVRAYAWIEIAIAAFALAVPFLLAALPQVAGAWLPGLGFWPLFFARFLMALLVLLLPTILMGATLPILVAALARRDPRIGRLTAVLYGVNTLGAVAGVFATAFILFPLLGLWRSNVFGALLDASVGVLALATLARREDPEAAPLPAEPAADPAPRRASDPAARRPRLLLAVYASVGFTALVFEVCWTRALALVLGSSIYAFSAMLGAFLAGIALGSLAVRRLVDRLANPGAALALGLCLLGVFSLGVTLALPALPEAFLELLRRTGPLGTRLVLLQVLLCVVVQLPATLVLGALFPLLARLVAESPAMAGPAVGRVYFANTLGSAAGAFAAGFVLVPTLGLRDTLALASGVNLAAAGVVLLTAVAATPRIRALAAAPLAAALALLFVPIPFDSTALTSGAFRGPELVLDFGIVDLPLDGVPQNEVLYYRDGISSTVSVHREEGGIELRVNGKADASTRGDMSTQVLLGEVPMLFGPPARRVSVIGYASGVTAGAVARHPVERLDVIEIEPAILEAERFFRHVNGRPLDDPRVHVHLDDGRAHLGAHPGTYDVVISEPSNPWMSGVSNLFTREFFATARAALRPDGRLLQWVQLYAMPPEDLYSILAAVRSEFPYVYGFAHGDEEPDLLLLATLRPLSRADLPRWEDLTPAVRDDLRRVGNFSTTDVWSLLRLAPADIDVLVGQAPLVNRDDNLHIELATPWLLGAMQGEDTLGPNWLAFARFPLGVLPLLRALGEPLDGEQTGALALSYLRARHDLTVATAVLGEATKLGRSGHSMTTALLVARAFDRDGTLDLASQLATIDEAVALAPGAIEPLLVRAELRQEAEQHAAALADLDAALARAPDEVRAREIRLRVLRALGRDEDAVAELERLLASPYVEYDPTLWQTAGELYVATGRHARAVEVLGRYLRELHPAWADSWLQLATAHDGAGEPDAAARARRNAGIATANQLRALHRRARIARWRGWDDDARTLLEQLVALDPGNAAASAELASLPAPAPGD